MIDPLAGNQHQATPLWRFSPRTGLLLLGLFLLLCLVFHDGLAYLVDQWLQMEEYSHGFFLPAVTAFLIWQKKNELAEIPFKGSWIGVIAVVLGLLFFFLGELSTLFIIIQYAFLLVLPGLALAVAGIRIFKIIWIPLFLLFFAIPLPDFLYKGLSAKLQLLSSQLGVAFIRASNISVYLEGNIIDLGNMQLQVVEACNGLRYLFPLMSLAFICAYFYKVELWKRVLVFLSSIPITIFMNSFRIGVIGVTMEYFGKQAAEGFLHDFEGWAVFMASAGILVAEMWVLARIGHDPRPLKDVFGLEMPEPLPADTQFRDRELPRQFWVVGAMLLAALGLSLTLERREEVLPQRTIFAEFPMRLGAWTGRSRAMEQQYIDTLKFEDYIFADFTRGPLFDGEGIISEPSQVRNRDLVGAPVNFYSAYYASQRKGESIHSPSSCIPGGGWQITMREVVALNYIELSGQPLKVNRMLIQKGEDRQLVYYWFQQRGRDLTSEYAVKWYLFLDALKMNRTDGALVRLTTYAPKGEDLAAADRRLVDFLSSAAPVLDQYIPK